MQRKDIKRLNIWKVNLKLREGLWWNEVNWIKLWFSYVIFDPEQVAEIAETWRLLEQELEDKDKIIEEINKKFKNQIVEQPS